MGMNIILLLRKNALCHNSSINKNQNLLGSEQENGYPVVKYHKSCRTILNLKRNLDQLTKDPLEPKDKRRSFREKGGSTSKVDKDKVDKNIFSAKCIFCRIEKYVKNCRTREKFNSCT